MIVKTKIYCGYCERSFLGLVHDDQLSDAQCPCCGQDYIANPLGGGFFKCEMQDTFDVWKRYDYNERLEERKLLPGQQFFDYKISPDQLKLF